MAASGMCVPTAKLTGSRQAVESSRTQRRVRALARPAAVRPGQSRRAMTVSAVAEAERTRSSSASSPAAVPELATKLKYTVGKPESSAPKDVYQATAWSVREKLIDAFEKTHDYWEKKDPKFVYYLSAEFLMGRSLLNTVYNLGLEGDYGKKLTQLGFDLEEMDAQEQNAALGNGGLGRLAACFLDSIATLDLPGWGYGIRYKYGMFKQGINKDGYQVEMPDIWLTNGNPWEIKRQDIKFQVGFGGTTHTKKVGDKTVTVWEPSEKVVAQAYDNPIPGYRTATTTNLRLWEALPVEEFDLTAFNAGQYEKAVHQKDVAEAISAVLYPNDSTPEGKELRLKQQYFFVAASIKDVLTRFKAKHADLATLPDKAAFQLNDTHPTIAVAELMRILVDEEGMEWDAAWNITSKALNYTNHTVMPEALEKWPVAVMTKMLPRHMEIIEIIDAGWRKFLADKFASLPEEQANNKIAELAIIQENPWNKGELLVNMAYLACVGSAAVNGVAAIHTEILKDTVLADFYKLFPDKFQNKTNGVTPRRWLAWCNPELSALITEALGTDAWINDCSLLRGLEKFSNDKAFRAKWRAVKQLKKQKLAGLIKQVSGDDVDTSALFDIHIKRIHEYKRQYMNVLSIIRRYKLLKAMTPAERKKVVKRVCIIGGKAASAYDMAKRIIRLVTAVGDVINKDPDTKDYLRLYFLPDYNVSLAETIIPAAELSQHISTAGTEASGTSNMKFQMNGCLIIGTMDGANVEIGEETGFENLFVFGVDAADIHQLRKERKDFKTDPRWDELMADIEGGMFGDKEYFKPLIDSVNNMNVGNDWFLLANDFASYLDAHEKVDEVYADPEEWTRKSILYTAGSGKFSSDRTIAEYAEQIWDVVPVKVPDN